MRTSVLCAKKELKTATNRTEDSIQIQKVPSERPQLLVSPSGPRTAPTAHTLHYKLTVLSVANKKFAKAGSPMHIHTHICTATSGAVHG